METGRAEKIYSGPFQKKFADPCFDIGGSLLKTKSKLEPFIIALLTSFAV